MEAELDEGNVATLIESCICPPGYAGLSCQVPVTMATIDRLRLSLSNVSVCLSLTRLSAGLCFRVFPSASV